MSGDESSRVFYSKAPLQQRLNQVAELAESTNTETEQENIHVLERARALDRACVDLVEAVLLESKVGEEYTAVVVDERREYDVVQLHWPAVRARVPGGGRGLGRRVQVRLTAADPARRRVDFVAV